MISGPVTAKRCSACGVEKALDAFNKNQRSPDGLYTWCRDCTRERGKQYRAAGPAQEKARARSKKWHKDNWPKLRDLRFKRVYGIGADQYQTMYSARGGACDGCGQVFPMYGKDGLHIDHDHQDGKVRGLLCAVCNTTIGFVRDNAETLRRLASYVSAQDRAFFGRLDMTEWVLKVCELPSSRPDQEALLNRLGSEGWEPVAIQGGTAYLKKDMVPALPNAVSVNNMPVMHAPEGPLTTPPGAVAPPLMTVENAMLWAPDTTRGEKRLVSLSSQVSGVTSSEHTHRVLVIVCEKGKIIRSVVDPVQNHGHAITMLGMLDEADGHVHTFDYKLLG